MIIRNKFDRSFQREVENTTKKRQRYVHQIKYSNNRFVRISNKIPRFNFHDFKFVSTLSARIFVEYSNYCLTSFEIKRYNIRTIAAGFRSGGKKNRRKIFLQK